LSPTGWPVGVLRAVIQALVPPVLDPGQYPADGGRIAGQSVGSHHAGTGAAAIQHPTQEPLGGSAVPALLDEDVEHHPLPVHGAPEPVAAATHLELHLVDVPFVAGPWPAAPQGLRVGGAELPTPLMDGLVRDGDAPLRHQLLDVAQAQTEAVVQPDAMAD